MSFAHTALALARQRQRRKGMDLTTMSLTLNALAVWASGLSAGNK